MNLSPDRFARARTCLLTQARPLEREMFLHEFEGVGCDRALYELSRFQNPDGGFGNSLEPDFRLPDSSTLATSIGLQHLWRLQDGNGRNLVEGALHYLEGTLDRSSLAWEPVPPSIDRCVRAPWWDYGDWHDNRMNPTAEIIGYLWSFPGAVDASLRDELTDMALTRLAEHQDTLEMHDLMCYLRLAERLPASVAGEFYVRLDRHVEENVSESADEWAAYKLTPLQVAPSRRAHYYPRFRNAVEENLAFLLRTQGADGAWEPTWEWGRSPDAWAAAKGEWKGVLTLDALRSLSAFDRLETVGP